MTLQLNVSELNEIARPNSKPKPSLLKTLREQKKISRLELARRSNYSVYQIETLEKGEAQNTLSKLLSCTEALGYDAQEILQMVLQSSKGQDSRPQEGILGKSLSQKNFEQGSKLKTYYEQNGHFVGSLELSKNHSLETSQIHTSDLFFGIVREGSLTIDCLTNSTHHKKNAFFILPGNTKARLLNLDGYNWTTNILIVSVKLTPAPSAL